MLQEEESVQRSVLRHISALLLSPCVWLIQPLVNNASTANYHKSLLAAAINSNEAALHVFLLL